MIYSFKNWFVLREEQSTSQDTYFSKTFDDPASKEALKQGIPQANVRVIGDVHNYIDKPGPKGYSYMDLVQRCNYSVQVGDMGGEFGVGVNAGGYDYSPLQKLDPKKHVFLGGNHDNYDALPQHHLGDFGTYQFPGFNFFYIRGAWSINWRSARVASVKDKHWWSQEEIGEEKVGPAMEAFIKAKPDIVITHDCPTDLISLVTANDKKDRYAKIDTKQTERIKIQLKNQGMTPPSDDNIDPYLLRVAGGEPSRTNSLLQRAWNAHRPKMWIFGHHHNFAGNINFGQVIGGTQFVGLGILDYMDF